MAKELKKGDHVAWQSHGGTAHGVVEKKLVKDATVAGHEVKASADDPQYVVRSESGSGKAAHKPGALRRE